jgi:hypothetical protein
MGMEGVMSKKRLFVTVGGTVACAFGIGFVMQKEPAPSIPGDALNTVEIHQVQLEQDVVSEDAPLDLTEIKLTSALPEISMPSFRNAKAGPEAFQGHDLPKTPTDPDMPRLGCNVDAAATAVRMASVELTVAAACFGNERVTIHHNGMMFTDTTNELGQLQVTVPALAEQAVFIISFSNGHGAVAQTQVHGLTDYDRVVVQWSGNNGFQVHAREFGAAYGDSGHVWAGSESSQSDGSSGVLTRLGDADTLAPQIAEVYTFPVGATDRSGTVALSVETEVTEANCGHDIAAQSIELKSGAKLKTRELVLAMPNCSAVGDFLVLNNLVDDLKIAAN